MTKPSQARAQAIKVKLVRYAQAVGLPYERALTHFLLERAAYRLLLDERLARALVFKGGYVSVRIYGSPRYTTDIDAVLHNLTDEIARGLVTAAMSHRCRRRRLVFVRRDHRPRHPKRIRRHPLRLPRRSRTAAS